MYYFDFELIPLVLQLLYSDVLKLNPSILFLPQAHTTGVNCENCELGYYRPTGTPPDAEVPCLPCECNFMGTAGPCIRDDSQIHLGKVSVS